MKFVNILVTWLYKRYSSFRSYRVVFVNEIPEKPNPFKLYVAGENEFLWFAAMVCPCGCGETLYMNLQNDSKPCWSLTKSQNGAPGLHPSVWRQKGCYSHFILRNGRVLWC